MIKNITTTTVGATLTQKELFQRFLESPFYESGTISILGGTPRVSEGTMQECRFHYYGLEAVCLPDELPDQMIEELRECDDPLYEMESAIGDLEQLLHDLKALKSEFSKLADATQVEAPDEETLDPETFNKAFRDWEDNPRYVLPHAEDQHKTLREAHAAVSKLSKEGVVA